MRPIKFRVWDKSLEEMRYSINIPSDYTERNGSLDLINMFQTLNQRYVFMQYTGLKDINFKEIYEGDIYKAKMHVVKTGRTIESIEVVEDIRGDNVYYYDEVEVIGNIYEHPHLLEGNNDA